MTMNGIDISEHNGLINLEPYRGQFVIIRVGWGNFTLDKQFHRNVAECKRLGIPFGVYHYSYALNAYTAKKEAAAVLNAIAPYKNDIKVGVWLDMEDADNWKVNHGFRITHDVIAPICYAFCKAVEDAGYYTGIYTSSSWLQYVKGINDRFDKWVANWGSNNGVQQTNTSAYGTIQQYTSKPLDKNIMYVNISTYSKHGTVETSKNPSGTYKPVQEHHTQPATPAVNTSFHVGDTVVPTVLKDVHGNSLKQWDKTYTVTAINGSNLTLSARGQVWAVLPSGNVKKVGAVNSTPAKTTSSSGTIKVGDKVKVIKAVDYNGRPFKTWYQTYTIMELKGNRAVIGVNGVVTAAINIHNLAKA